MRVHSPADRVQWAVESDGVRLLGPGGATKYLAYPEAALWDFVVRGVSDARTTAMMRHIGSFATEAETAAFVSATLEAWYLEGLVELRHSADHGKHLRHPTL